VIFPRFVSRRADAIVTLIEAVPYGETMTASSWESLAAWYDEKQGDTGDLWHRTLIDPALLRVLGRVRGLRILDLGCGNGYLSRRFARAGARVVGVDSSAPIIKRAKRRESAEPLGIAYHVADAAHLDFLVAERFDVVVCNMALMDIEDAEGAIGEVGRVLRKGGRLVASISHPCFDQGTSSTWLLERSFRSLKVSRRIARYRRPFSEETPWGIEERAVTTTGYHRPLSWYARALRDAGLLIRSLEEPEPTKEFIEGSPQGPYMAEIPLHLVIEAVKTGPQPPVGEHAVAAKARARPPRGRRPANRR